MNALLLAWWQRRKRRRSRWALGVGFLSVLFAGATIMAGGARFQALSQQCQPSGSSGAGQFVTTSGGWTRVGATIDQTYGGGAFGSFYNGGMSYAELGATPGYPNYVYGGLIGKALGIPGNWRGIPGGYPLLIRAVGSNSPGYRILKSDIGSGQAGEPHYVIDLHPKIAGLIHFSGKQDVEIKPAGSSPGAPVSMPIAQQCVLAASAGPGQYVNPFRDSMKGLVSQRIDMGVDYDNAPGAPILAIGRARVLGAGTGIGGNWHCTTGINGGVYYKLLDGPDAGRSVYVTEDIVPTVKSGDLVAAGAMVARFDPGGSTPCIEIGWGSGTPYGTEAVALNQQAAGDPGGNTSFCGQLMSQLIASLGGKPGVLGGPKSGSSCPVM